MAGKGEAEQQSPLRPGNNIMKSKSVGWLFVLAVAVSVRPMLLSGANRQTLLAHDHEQAPTVSRSTSGGQAPSLPAAPTNVRILSDGEVILFDDFLGASIDSAKWTVLD